MRRWSSAKDAGVLNVHQALAWQRSLRMILTLLAANLFNLQTDQQAEHPQASDRRCAPLTRPRRPYFAAL